MNIIASGIIANAQKSFASLKAKLGSNLNANGKTLDSRIDAISNSLYQISNLTNDRIQADMINLMNLHDRLNAVQNLGIFQKSNLYFNDFVYSTGSYTTMTHYPSSTKYVQESVNTSYWHNLAITSDATPTQCMLIVNGENLDSNVVYKISRDAGTTFYTLTPNAIFTFQSGYATGQSLIIRIENIPILGELRSVGLIWTS